MNPVAISFGPLEIRWYGILIALAVILGLWLANREVKRKGLSEDIFFNIVIITLPFAFLGARLYYVLFNLDYYMENPGEIFAVWQGGLAIHGGVIFMLLIGFFATRHYNYRFLKLADIVSPPLILGQAIGRWGNFFNQEAYGFVVDPEKVPWAMFIDGAWRHPTFLYESVWNVLIFIFLLFFRRSSKAREGEVFFLYLMLYSLGRFFIEGLRTDSLMMGPLRAAQVISLAMFLTGLIAMVYRRKTREKRNFR